MSGYEYDLEAVETVNAVLDEIGLREHRDRLVVVGGSALAAWGVKPLGETDLDIAITDDLRRELKSRPQWWEAELTPRQLDYYPKIAHGVTAITPPFSRDGTYGVDAAELVAEGIACGEAGYKYSPLWRILDTKLALADAPGEREIHQARRAKHWRDALLIASFILEHNEAE